MTFQQQAQLTWEDLKNIVLATTKQVEETGKQVKETTKQVEKTTKQVEKTTKQVEKTTKQVEETGKQVKETTKQMKETDRKLENLFKETDERLDRTSKQIEEANKRYGGFTNEFGKIVEDLCRPAALKIFRKEGIDIDHTYEGSRRERVGEEEMEVDVLLCNKTEAVAVEVKTTCYKKDVDYFLRKMKRFKGIFHEFEGKAVYAAVAAMRFANGSDKYARRKGLYVLSPLSDGMFSLEKPNNREVF